MIRPVVALQVDPPGQCRLSGPYTSKEPPPQLSFHVAMLLMPKNSETPNMPPPMTSCHRSTQRCHWRGLLGRSAVASTPDDMNRANHRITSTNQHPTSMGTTQSIVHHTARERSCRDLSKMAQNDVEVAAPSPPPSRSPTAHSSALLPNELWTKTELLSYFLPRLYAL